MRWVVWVLLAPYLLWTVVRLAGVEPHIRISELLAFTPYVALASPVPLLVAALARRWVACAVAVLVTIGLGACMAPRWLADDDRGPTDGVRLRVLTANLMVGSGADPADVLRLVRELDVDALAVQELTPEAGRGLDDAGIASALPHRVTYPYPGVEGSGVYSRHPLAEGALRRLKASGFRQARATLRTPGATEVVLESVHPCAPIGINGHCWKPDLAEQPSTGPDGVPRILAGDFNATFDHAALRRVVERGYRDAAESTGDGFTATWPYDERWYVPGITLDRVLVDRRIGVVGVSAHRLGVSDHKAFFAELVLPPERA